MNFLRILENLGICLVCAIFAGCTYTSQGFPDEDRGAVPTGSADIYGDLAKKIVYPEQNWDPSDSLWFYNTTQGSDLMDYNIFLHLEQVDSPNAEGKIKLFRDYVNMNKFRFLPQRSTTGDKEEWLPVGWVKDSYEGKDYVGFTCAACHTTQVNYNNEQKGISVGIRIDGGPSMADIQTMFKELENALGKSLYDKDQDKFNRLAEKVLMPDATESEKKDFRDQIKKQYTKIKTLNGKDDPIPEKVDSPNERVNGYYGYGRLDAFGRIFNRIESVRSPSSIDQYHPGNAPVSYPFLWDTPHHDFVQWNGIAGNTGAGGLGPLGRNASEVLGVFATVHGGREEPWLITKLIGFGNYTSSLRKWNQVALERKIKHLWSPSWEQLAKDNALPQIQGLPEDVEKRAQFIKKIEAADGKGLDELMNGLSDWELGLAVFKKYKCALCHESIDRKDSDRRVISQFSNVDMIGTDKQMAENALTYCSRNEFPEVPEGQECMTPDGEKGEKGEKGIQGGEAITHLTGEVLINGALWDLPLFVVTWASNPWKSWIPFDTTEADRYVDFESADENNISKEQSLRVYKGRPLNGIWATAPYLHNGSVPNLYELFLPSSCEDKEGRQLKQGTTCRSKTFTVGSRELDTKKVGFKQLDNLKETYPKLVFDTSLLGNSNEGHEYVVGKTKLIKTKAVEKDGYLVNIADRIDGELQFVEVGEGKDIELITEKERWALVEYLKSL